MHFLFGNILAICTDVLALCQCQTNLCCLSNYICYMLLVVLDSIDAMTHHGKTNVDSIFGMHYVYFSRCPRSTNLRRTVSIAKNLWDPPVVIGSTP